MELVNKNKRKEITYLIIGLALISLVLFMIWADSPGKIEFYLDRDSNDVYNVSDTFSPNQEMYYRFVQTLEVETYQITILDNVSNKIYETFSLAVPTDLTSETALSGKVIAPNIDGTYILKVQDTKNDILVAEGQFNVR